MMSIAENLQIVNAEIAAAAISAARTPASVRLIAVSKTKPASDVVAAMAAGQVDFGENKVQEMVDKHALIPNAHWHLIGTLQRNKVKYIAGFVKMIHSVDSERLLEEINRQAELHHRQIDCLLQINISDEDQKGGLTEGEAEDLLRRIDEFPNVKIKGLMGMAAFSDDMALVRSQFERLANAKRQFQSHLGPQISMDELSMGMSGDFEAAIAAGSTMVRIGSSVFGGR